MSEYKEALRKSYDMAYDGFFPNYKERMWNWFYTKLKNQAEEYENQLTIKNGFLKIAQDSQNSFITQIDQLKAELSRKDDVLKAAEFARTKWTTILEKDAIDNVGSYSRQVLIEVLNDFKP